MAEMADVIDGVAEAASGSPETLPTHFIEAGDLHRRSFGSSITSE
jgi:hypothetical protein